MTGKNEQRDPISDAAASLLLPGLGQWLQRRRAAALWFGVETLVALTLGVVVPSVRPAAWVLGTLVGVGSVLDAAYGARRRAPAT